MSDPNILSNHTPEQQVVDTWYKNTPLSDPQKEALADNLSTEDLVGGLERRGLPVEIGRLILENMSKEPSVQPLPPLVASTTHEASVPAPAVRHETFKPTAPPENLRGYAATYVNPERALPANVQWGFMQEYWGHLMGAKLPQLTKAQMQRLGQAIADNPSMRLVAAPLFGPKDNIADKRNEIAMRAYEVAGLETLETTQRQTEASTANVSTEEVVENKYAPVEPAQKPLKRGVFGWKAQEAKEPKTVEDVKVEEGNPSDLPIYDQLTEHPMQSVKIATKRELTTSYRLRYQGPNGSLLTREDYLKAMEASGQAVRDESGMLWTVAVMDVRADTPQVQGYIHEVFEAQPATTTTESLLAVQLLHALAGTEQPQDAVYLANEAVFVAQQRKDGPVELIEPYEVAAIALYSDEPTPQGLKVTNAEESFNQRAIAASLAS